MSKTINARTFTPKYDEVEDRLRVVINYEDLNNRVDFMISRAFVLRLFPTLEEYMIKYYSSDVEIPVVTKQKMKENIKTDKQTAQTDATNLELLKTDNELLLEVNFSYKHTSKRTIVRFKSQNVVVVADLDHKSIKQIFSMIKSVIPFFSWGISQHI